MMKILYSDLEEGYFTRLFDEILVRCSVKPLPKVWYSLPEDIKEYFDIVYNFAGYKYKIINPIKEIPRFDIPESNKILVAFSGGKDSVAAAIKARKLGYEPILYFMKGINRSYPDELNHAKMIADKLEMEMVIREVKIVGKCDYLENPMKNQYIQAAMAQYGIENGIHLHCFGNTLHDDISTANIDRNMSDTLEVYNVIEKFFKRRIPNYRCITLLESTGESYYIIAKEYPELLDLIGSCMTPYRYKNKLRKINMKKYNITLPEGRCGSCYKCAVEYLTRIILFNEKGNKEYINKCINLLREASEPVYNMKFDKNTPNNVILENWIDKKWIIKYRSEKGDE